MNTLFERGGLGLPALLFFLPRLVLAACLLLMAAPRLAAQVQPAYLYNLSNFSGPLRDDGVQLYVDQARNETYVLYQNLIRLFNASGMEIFRFGDDLDVGHIVDLAVDDQGNVLLLSQKEAQPIVTVCNFRGVPLRQLEIRDLPAGLKFTANRMILRERQLYFVSLSTLSVIVTDADGQFEKHLDFLPLLDTDARQKEGAEMIGFTVDREGNIYFTVPTAFRAYKFSADGGLTSFGRSGSTPGRFGVIAGIAVDSRGNLLIADKLKCVVMVFDKDFTFVTEFGYRGVRPENLVVPSVVAVDGQNRIYVSQSRRRGVSVFAPPQG